MGYLYVVGWRTPKRIHGADFYFRCEFRTSPHGEESGSDKFRKGKRPFGSSPLPLPYQIALSFWLPPLTMFLASHFSLRVARSRLHLLSCDSSASSISFQLRLRKEIEDVKRKKAPPATRCKKTCDACI